MNVIQVSETAKQTIQLGRAHRWWWRVAELREYPLAPRYRDGWWFIPSDPASLPGFARRRVEAIQNAGIPIQGVVVAHEAPRLLPAPKIARTPKPVVPRPILRKALAVVAAVLGLLVYATGVSLIFGLTLLLDPVVYVVLDDGDGRPTWIEVVRWDEEAPCTSPR